MNKFLLVAFIFAFSSWTKAEYRAFELEISDEETGNSRTVISTFDHIQYPMFYPLNSSEQIRYLDSWMCWENTSLMRPICPKGTRDPASLSTNSEEN